MSLLQHGWSCSCSDPAYSESSVLQKFLHLELKFHFCPSRPPSNRPIHWTFLTEELKSCCSKVSALSNCSVLQILLSESLKSDCWSGRVASGCPVPRTFVVELVKFCCQTSSVAEEIPSLWRHFHQQEKYCSDSTWVWSDWPVLWTYLPEELKFCWQITSVPQEIPSPWKPDPQWRRFYYASVREVCIGSGGWRPLQVEMWWHFHRDQPAMNLQECHVAPHWGSCVSWWNACVKIDLYRGVVCSQHQWWGGEWPQVQLKLTMWKQLRVVEWNSNSQGGIVWAK